MTVLNEIIHAAVRAEIERLREWFYTYTAQLAAGFTGLFPDYQALGNGDSAITGKLKVRADTVLSATGAQKTVIGTAEQSSVRRTQKEVTAESAAGSAARSGSRQIDAATGGSSLGEEKRDYSGSSQLRYDTAKIAESLIRHAVRRLIVRLESAELAVLPQTANLTAAFETSTVKLAEGLETTVEKLTQTHAKPTELTPGYYYAITNNNRFSAASAPQEVNIYMTAAQPDDMTGDAVRRKLEEFSQNAFGGDDFFSRMRPR